MREIWFRGKGMASREWVYGWLLRRDAPMSPYEYNILTRDRPSCEASYFVPVYFDTIGQYTGLEDMNGTKIFEGDIVDILTENEDLAVVEYGYGGFVVNAENFATDFINDLNGADVEVVGNIYDNPEMISWER